LTTCARSTCGLVEPSRTESACGFVEFSRDVACDNDGDLSTPFIDEECVRHAERSSVLLRDQPDRVRARLHVTLDGSAKVIDRVEETAITILSARPLQNIAIIVGVIRDDRTYAHRSVDFVCHVV
jgi:hypothetical protein